MNTMHSFDSTEGDGLQMWSKVAGQLTGVPAPDDFEQAVLLKTALASLPSVESTVASGGEHLSFEQGVFQKAALSKLERVPVPENFEADVLLKIRPVAQTKPAGFPFKNLLYFILPVLFAGGFFALKMNEPHAEAVKSEVTIEKAAPAPVVGIQQKDTAQEQIKPDSTQAAKKKNVKKKRVKKDEWQPTRGTRP